MCFNRILEVTKIVMPLITGIVTVIVTSLVIPGLLDWRTLRKVRCCYRSVLSYFNRFCRSLGSGTGPCTVREVRFYKDSDIDDLIKKDQDKPALTEAQGWLQTNLWEFRTALNIARAKAGLESGLFYFSRHFRGKNYSELLAVLTVCGNTATMQAFCRGPWVFPQKTKKDIVLRKIKVKFFGYDRLDYSLMLV